MEVAVMPGLVVLVQDSNDVASSFTLSVEVLYMRYSDTIEQEKEWRV